LNNKPKKVVIFADLDGSLLSRKYQSEDIEPILKKLKTLNTSIVFASSKTKSEIIHYREKWQIKDPFIVENGSAIFIPQEYFQQNYTFSKRAEGYNIIELGVSYEVVRQKLAAVKKMTGTKIVGFGDMTAKQIAEDSGLPLYLAELAKKREHSEPLKIVEGSERAVLQAIVKEGLCYTRGGRYLHVLGDTDKGKAAAVLKDLFVRQCGEIFTIGVGDSDNDLGMLKIVDKPFFVGKTLEKKAVWEKIQKLTEPCVQP
jgi:mannosyl-3-phosphoglycerate phosphatase